MWRKCPKIVDSNLDVRGAIAAVAIALFVSATCKVATANPPSFDAQAVPVRARDLGVPFHGTPGTYNAITDVAGLEVGQTTLISGDGKLIVGKGPVRTGVTVILPTGRMGNDAVAAGRAVINGTGEWTGMLMVDETGLLFGPIALTGTGNISVVREALIDWAIRPGYIPQGEWFTRLLPAVGETLDLRLNDVFGHHLTREDVFAALNGATSGRVSEGNVGGGTGMVSYQFKGGIGTSSRVVNVDGKRFIVGVLLQANHGRRSDLRIAGVPVGEEITDLMPTATATGARAASDDQPGEPLKNSCLIVIATDAPLLPHQLQRLARRAALGLGRNGSFAGDLSGELALALSTTNRIAYTQGWKTMSIINDKNEAVFDALFQATVDATEEALVNQLVAARTMTGANGMTVFALPHERLVELLKKYHRYSPPPH
jgi:L-aminopeptidase/D-esterase-like protein